MWGHLNTCDYYHIVYSIKWLTPTLTCLPQTWFFLMPSTSRCGFTARLSRLRLWMKMIQIFSDRIHLEEFRCAHIRVQIFNIRYRIRI
jgi:hypothetical protein